MNNSRLRAWMLFWIGLYQILFTYIYVNWASPNFYYLGLTHNVTNTLTMSASVLMLIVAAVVLGTRINIFSDFVGWILYLIILTPALLILPLQDMTAASPLFHTTSLFLSFILIVTIPRHLVLRESHGIRQIPPRSFFAIFLGAHILLTVIMLASYWNVMSFVSLNNIYYQRTIAASSGASSIAVYATSWLQSAFNPFLITVGLFDRTLRWCLAIGVIGQVLVYSVFAGKAALVGMVVVFGYFYFAVRRQSISVVRLVAVVVALMVVVLLAWQVNSAMGRGNSSPLGILISLVYMRTFSLPAAFNGVYASFFETNPLTYYSHVNLISLFTDYPYTEALGYVVGRDIIYLAGGSGVFNANANFWATDGTAALGNTGVVIVGIVLGISLSFANKFASARKLVFATTLSIPYLMSLTNGGFFTSLVTGGGFILVLLVGYGIPGNLPGVAGRFGSRARLSKSAALRPVRRQHLHGKLRSRQSDSTKTDYS